MSALIERALRPYLALEIFSDRESAFTLDASRLDIATLGDGTEQPQWDDWIAQATGITIRRGGVRDGVTINNDAGTLTVSIRHAAIDDIAPAFVGGQPLRLVFKRAGQRHLLFTGKIDTIALDVTLTPTGKRVPVITLTAVDNTAEHLAVTRYGAMPPTGSETFTERISRLNSSARAPIEIPTSIDGPRLGRTVYESSLANHLTLACNTVGAMWYVGGDGVTRFQDRVYDEDNAVALGDGSGAEDFIPSDGHVLGDSLVMGKDALFNIPIFHVLGAVRDEDDPNAWVADERDMPGYPRPSLQGRRPVTIMTNHADDPPIEADEGWLWISPYDVAGVVDALTWNAQDDLDLIPRLDLGASVATLRSIPNPGVPPNHRNIVIGINHTITPTRWIVGLNLIGAYPRGL